MTHEELIEDGKKSGYSAYREDGKTVAMFERDGKAYKLGFLEGDGKECRRRAALAFHMRNSLRWYDEGDQDAILAMGGH